MPFTALFTADRERRFADWGVDVVLRVVTETYDPQSLQTTETHTDTSITAIPGEAPSTPATGTRGIHLNHDLTFLIKSEDLTGSEPSTNLRIVYNNDEHDVVNFHLSPDGQTYAVGVRKRS